MCDTRGRVPSALGFTQDSGRTMFTHFSLSGPPALRSAASFRASVNAVRTWACAIYSAKASRRITDSASSPRAPASSVTSSFVACGTRARRIARLPLPLRERGLGLPGAGDGGVELGKSGMSGRTGSGSALPAAGSQARANAQALSQPTITARSSKSALDSVAVCATTHPIHQGFSHLSLSNATVWQQRPRQRGEALRSAPLQLPCSAPMTPASSTALTPLSSPLRSVHPLSPAASVSPLWRIVAAGWARPISRCQNAAHSLLSISRTSIRVTTQPHSHFLIAAYGLYPMLSCVVPAQSSDRHPTGSRRGAQLSG